MSVLASMRAPRRVEALLQSLGADPEFADDVLGDLAEEFEVRCRWDGALAARRWYYREAVRTAPHLLRDWRRRFRLRDTAPLTWALLAGFAMESTVSAMFVRLTFLVTGVPINAWLHHVQTTGDVIPWLTAMMVVRVTIPPMTAGFVAGTIGRRAALPHSVLVSAGMLAVAAIRAALLGAPMATFAKALVLNAGWLGLWSLAGGAAAALWLRRADLPESQTGRHE